MHELEKEKEVIRSELKKQQDANVTTMCDLKTTQCKLECAVSELKALRQCLDETIENTENEKKANEVTIEELKR